MARSVFVGIDLGGQVWGQKVKAKVSQGEFPDSLARQTKVDRIMAGTQSYKFRLGAIHAMKAVSSQLIRK